MHSVGSKMSPVEAKRFIDEINHPLVGWYFDIGNVLRYGWPEHWIRTLNSRIMKLHIKEFSRELMNSKGLWEGFKVDLLKGDNNWPVVMQAVRQINHAGGWLTAEVNGGDRNHLKTDLGTNGCDYWIFKLKINSHKLMQRCF